MTSTTNASAMPVLTDALAQFSKAVYSAFTEIENQSSLEVLRAVSETREATLEAQGWKQATADAKATIAHQAEKIVELQREVCQWKDQSRQWKDQARNWQEHFNRVEGERCALSSRIDELMKLQYTHPLLTPKQKYASASPPHSIDSAPQSRQTNHGTTLKRQRDLPLANSSEEPSHTSTVVSHPNLSSSKRKTKANDSTIAATSSSQQDPQIPFASCSTLIRRVQAVIHVKREESDDDSAEDFSATANILKDDASDRSENVGANKRRLSRRSRKIIGDDDDVEQHYLAADGNPVLESRHLRHRNGVVNYREEDDDDDDDDELMMGAEENHDEVYGTQRVETLDSQRSKQQRSHPTNPTSVTAPPLKKRRKVAAR